MDYIIAIDGPSGVGKGTIAKKLSKILNINYIDTGAMYRAVAYTLITNNISLDDHKEIKKILPKINMEFKNNVLYLEGKKVGKEIRTEEISKSASLVSSYDYVREYMVSLQRKLAEFDSCVLDGRDVGTVIFPKADYKFYLNASLKERARRRYLQSGKKNGFSLKEVMESIEKRDYEDMHREHSPLKKADDAIEIDSTEKSLKDTIIEVLSYIREEKNV
ncbi:MAG: (d)CMP kinase [Peptoniphilaceae bacterium]|uniref:(d)CMP kinase n=1 Tax=Parvimonas sp. TaxID=1944660 RepID=UPI0025DF7AFD|nr:(d)CMP kinase [Parvimonas sp.]MCI5996856.1 (d)CMP kinase [Parvimonas sp.]MDD7764652.1 (d)CMP kinase [Peptoniphilaceae bacterium]MDY3050501.1 (d)CMP kinase [Parvimonas sp.]